MTGPYREGAGTPPAKRRLPVRVVAARMWLALVCAGLALVILALAGATVRAAWAGHQGARIAGTLICLVIGALLTTHSLDVLDHHRSEDS